MPQVKLASWMSMLRAAVFSVTVLAGGIAYAVSFSLTSPTSVTHHEAGTSLAGSGGYNDAPNQLYRFAVYSIDDDVNPKADSEGTTGPMNNGMWSRTLTATQMSLPPGYYLAWVEYDNGVYWSGGGGSGAALVLE